MNKEIVVIKLGGASLHEGNVLDQLVRTVAGYLNYDYRVVIIHGGGPNINQELVKRNISWEFINGQRKTTPEMMTVIEEVLNEKVNAQLVDHLRSHSVNAIGMSGADSGLLNCSKASEELGQVGKIDEVSIDLILKKLFESKNSVPVIAPIGVDQAGVKYNINADWAASKIASALKASKLIFLSDIDGILNDEKNLVPFASHEDLKAMIESGVVTGGMYTKVSTVIDAIEEGVGEVRVMRGKDAHKGLWSDYVGTFCSLKKPDFISFDPVGY